MLKGSKLYLKLKKIIKEYDLEDIILFGSFVKGKTIAKDIDICLIFKKSVDLKIIKKIQAKLGDNFHISSLSVDNFLNKKHNLTQTLLFEGISIKSRRSLSDVYSLKSYGLYYYDISEMKKSNKVRFVYLLKGRGNEKGIVKEFKGQFLVNGCFIIPVEKDNEMLEILRQWNVKFKRKMVLLIC
jgi:predicted nucleotidyltransferase